MCDDVLKKFYESKVGTDFLNKCHQEKIQINTKEKSKYEYDQDQLGNPRDYDSYMYHRCVQGKLTVTTQLMYNNLNPSKLTESIYATYKDGNKEILLGLL